jgi:hypothetical protein
MSEKIISRLSDERGLGDRKLLAREAAKEIMRLCAENAALRDFIATRGLEKEFADFHA